MISEKKSSIQTFPRAKFRPDPANCSGRNAAVGRRPRAVPPRSDSMPSGYARLVGIIGRMITPIRSLSARDVAKGGAVRTAAPPWSLAGAPGGSQGPAWALILAHQSCTIFKYKRKVTLTLLLKQNSNILGSTGALGKFSGAFIDESEPWGLPKWDPHKALGLCININKYYILNILYI